MNLVYDVSLVRCRGVGIMTDVLVLLDLKMSALSEQDRSK